MKQLTYLTLVVVVIFTLFQCKKSPEPVTPGGSTNPGSNTAVTGTSTAPTLTTATAPATSGISSTTATLSAVIDGNGGAAISQHGFVYSKTSQTPTTADSKTELGATAGPFPLTITGKLTGLDANTTYYARAYATNDKGTGYGAVAQVKTGTAAAATGELSGTWVERAKFPTDPRNDFWLVAVNDKVYLLGGYSTTQRYYDAWEYDPASNRWTEKAKTTFTQSAIFFPPIRPLVANGKIFFPAAVGPTPNDVKANVHEFDPVANKWSVKGALPTGFDPYGTAAFVIGDKAYFAGHSSSAGFVKKVWEYTISSDKWTQKGDLTGPLSSGSIGASINGKGLVIGASEPGQPIATLSYDPATDKWTTASTRDYLSAGSSSKTLGFSSDKIVDYNTWTGQKYRDGVMPIVLTLDPLKVTPQLTNLLPYPKECDAYPESGLSMVHVGDRVFALISNTKSLSKLTTCDKEEMGKLYEFVKK
ncbi:Kelch repeat-containing protein [Larkinella ripae]